MMIHPLSFASARQHSKARSTISSSMVSISSRRSRTVRTVSTHTTSHLQVQWPAISESSATCGKILHFWERRSMRDLKFRAWHKIGDCSCGADKKMYALAVLPLSSYFHLKPQNGFVLFDQASGEYI